MVNSRNGSTTSAQAGPRSTGINSGRAKTQRNEINGIDTKATMASALVRSGETLALVLHLRHDRKQDPLDDPLECCRGHHHQVVGAPVDAERRRTESASYDEIFPLRGDDRANLRE